MYSYVFTCIHMYLFNFIYIFMTCEKKESTQFYAIILQASKPQPGTTQSVASTQKKQIPSTPSNHPPFHPSNSHYGKRFSTYHSNLQAYTNES